MTFITTKQLAKLAGCSTATIRRRVKEGDLDGCWQLTDGGHTRFNKAPAMRALGIEDTSDRCDVLEARIAKLESRLSSITTALTGA